MTELKDVLSAIALVKKGNVKKVEINNITIYRVKDIVRVDIKVEKENN